MTSVIEKQVSQKARGRVRCQIIDARTKRVKRDCGWQNNLILNQGMDMIATRAWSACFTHAVAGTGTSATSVDSGTTQATQSGTGVTLSGGSFVFTNTATDAGTVIKWDTGEIAMVVSVTNPTTVVVDRSATVSAGEFTVFLTNQTGLTTEVKRSSTYLLGAGNTETVTTDIATGVYKMRRTFDFSAESGSVTYNEVGMSFTATVASNLFARIKLNTPLSLVSGDQLRVVYELQLTLTPFSPRANTPTITGWTGTDGDEMLENVGMYSVSSSDGGATSTIPNVMGAINEPSVSSLTRIYLSTNTTALQTSPSTAGVSFVVSSTVNKAVTLASYTALSFTRNKTITFLTSEGNMVNLRKIFVGYTSSTLVYPGICFLLDNNQTKANTTALTVNFKFTWDRTLA